MKTFIQHHWKMRYSHLLLWLYCITFPCYFVPISANSITGSPSSVTQHSEAGEVTSQKLSHGQIITISAGRGGKIGKERVNHQVPEAARKETRQTTKKNAQYDARARLTNFILPKIPINIRSITKRSAQEISFPDESANVFHYSNSRDLKHSVNDCEDDASLCNKQVLNAEGLQHMTDFKINNQMPWDNHDSSNYWYSDDKTYNPVLHYSNLGLYSKKSIGGSTSDEYYAYPPQEDMNRVSEEYTQSHHNVLNQLSSQFPGVVVLTLHKPTTTDLIRQSHSEDGDKYEGSLATSQDNAGDVLEPKQEVKKNIFTSRGWGAGGMPFNILYMHQQQHTKPASRSVVAGAQQLVAPAPLHGSPTASQYPQVAVRNALSSALREGSNGGGSGTPLPTRRQYSIIPQLYVSYGWGPHGK